MTTPRKKSRPIWLKTILPILIILIVIVAGLSVVKSTLVGNSGGKPETGFEVEVGVTVPDFKLKKFGGGELQLSSLGAKVTLVNFWATWCEACVEEMPSIVKLRDHFKDQGFEVVAVNVDENPDAVVPKSLKQLGINFGVYVDPSAELAERFGVHAIPLTVILDRNRKILFVENGEKDWFSKDFQSKITDWLAANQGPK